MSVEFWGEFVFAFLTALPDIHCHHHIVHFSLHQGGNIIRLNLSRSSNTYLRSQHNVKGSRLPWTRSSVQGWKWNSLSIHWIILSIDSLEEWATEENVGYSFLRTSAEWTLNSFPLDNKVTAGHIVSLDPHPCCFCSNHGDIEWVMLTCTYEMHLTRIASICIDVLQGSVTLLSSADWTIKWIWIHILTL